MASRQSSRPRAGAWSASRCVCVNPLDVTALLILIAVLASAWYRLSAAMARSAPLSTRLVLSSLGMSGQLVVTVTLAGAVGQLRAAVVGPAAVVLSVILFGIAVRAARAPARRQTAADTRQTAGDTRQTAARDLRAIAAGLRAAAAWENVLLAGLFAFAAAWIATAIRFYPPRGIDDVTYHLTPVYQAIQDHRLTLLPVALRGHFVSPLNGEMLFLPLPLIYWSIRWIATKSAIAWN